MTKSTELAVGTDLPAAIVEPPMFSRGLESLVRTVLNPHPAQVGQPLEVSTWHCAEARRHLAIIAQAMAPVTPRHLRSWLAALNRGVRNPLSETDLVVRVASVMQANPELPARAVNQRSLRDAMLKFDFTPSVAELSALWAEPTRELTGRRRALQIIAAAPQQQIGSEMPLEAREAVLARHREKMAEVERERVQHAAVERPEASGATGRASRLSRETLNAIYARRGIQGPMVVPAEDR